MHKVLMHLLCVAFEESATSTREERVASEHCLDTFILYIETHMATLVLDLLVSGVRCVAGSEQRCNHESTHFKRFILDSMGNL
jgi:hypothetical protein